MPPVAKLSTQDILLASAALVQSSGLEALNVRSLAQALGVSTTPILQAFGKMEELKEALFLHLHQELHQPLVHRFDLPPWLRLLGSYVLYAWREPLKFQALQTWFRGSGSGESWDALVAALAADPRCASWPREKVLQGAFRASAYANGFADFASRGLLYDPSADSILEDFRQGTELLILGSAP